jgi:hypothetical protein
MDRARTNRERPNSFGICRYAQPAGNSFAFCTCETASHLFIPHPLKTTRVHGFAEKSHLTLAFCADPRSGGGTPPLASQHPTRRLVPSEVEGSERSESKGQLPIPPEEQRHCFQPIANSRSFPFIPSPVFSGDYAFPGGGGSIFIFKSKNPASAVGEVNREPLPLLHGISIEARIPASNDVG